MTFPTHAYSFISSHTSKQERGGSKSSEIRKPTSFLEPLCWKRGGLGNSILPVIAGGGPSDKLAPVQISPNALLKLPHGL